MKSIFALAFITLFAHLAQAGFFVASLGSSPVLKNKNTHVVIAGRGSELGTLFQYTAASKALKIQELYPQDQVVLLATNEIGESANAAKIKGWGFQILAYRADLFTAAKLLKELSQFSRIRSIDMYTHVSAIMGAQLEGEAYRFSQRNVEIAQIKPLLTADAFIVLHGCNSGFYLAPMLSATLGVPVAGSFTSTQFERIHTLGDFYSYEDSLKPTTGDWSPVNSQSFNQPKACTGAGCIRMKPDNWPYTGGWGDYNGGGGLPFYKFFCAKNSEARCLTAMAESLFGLISTQNYNFSSSYDSYKTLVKDFMCPINAKRSIRADCSAALDKAESTGLRNYNPFAGKLLTCDFKSCQFELKCQYTSDGQVMAKTCRLSNDKASSTAFVDEYLTYLKAFSYFKNR